METSYKHELVGKKNKTKGIDLLIDFTWLPAIMYINIPAHVIVLL